MGSNCCKGEDGNDYKVKSRIKVKLPSDKAKDLDDASNIDVNGAKKENVDPAESQKGAGVDEKRKNEKHILQEVEVTVPKDVSNNHITVSANNDGIQNYSCKPSKEKICEIRHMIDPEAEIKSLTHQRAIMSGGQEGTGKKVGSCVSRQYALTSKSEHATEKDSQKKIVEKEEEAEEKKEEEEMPKQEKDLNIFENKSNLKNSENIKVEPETPKEDPSICREPVSPVGSRETCQGCSTCPSIDGSETPSQRSPEVKRKVSSAPPSPCSGLPEVKPNICPSPGKKQTRTSPKGSPRSTTRDIHIGKPCKLECDGCGKHFTVRLSLPPNLSKIKGRLHYWKVKHTPSCRRSKGKHCPHRKGTSPSMPERCVSSRRTEECAPSQKADQRALGSRAEGCEAIPSSSLPSMPNYRSEGESTLSSCSSDEAEESWCREENKNPNYSATKPCRDEKEM